ncbi:bis-aminopropyl spermidine synthase family protein [Siminovitchia sp. FSL H7-0308]|uniref:bis-aminopropyl spermidine synthase family protein n=1 Tax=unclassified Siminovitchia TaxID=2837530 RepID=UPI0030CEB2BF
MNYIDRACQKIQVEEGRQAVERLLIECYVKPGISTKELSRSLQIPVPITVAIRNELVKAGALTSQRGTRCTFHGKRFVETELGYTSFHRELWNKISSSPSFPTDLFVKKYRHIYDSRPQINAVIDQSKCTPETSFKRAIHAIRSHSVIGKKVLCVGDDDLVSVSLALILKKLLPNRNIHTNIQVIDIDNKMLEHIENISRQYNLEIDCLQWDVRNPLPKEWADQFDCVFTDPPYTSSGLSLFLSRGIEALKNQIGLKIYLSYAHKHPNFMLRIQEEITKLGLSATEIMPNFNEYEGAQILGGSGQLMTLTTTCKTTPLYTDTFEKPLYTGEIKQTLRQYSCKKCRTTYHVGFDQHYKTIEQLKKAGCSACYYKTFDLIKREVKNVE